ncbi:NB-ARC domains-containing protein [Tanacetum coccineum]|uniref:NB-ARC domains-containing protein n=1 Tax=Tanacetum coccineum TaxID=301880 RepID=A0ABQ4Z149_9ASTR
MAELVLCALLPVVFEKLTSVLENKIARAKGIHSELKKWEKKLLLIQAFLEDASQKGVKSKAVKQWLNDLQHLAYDIDDILDALATDAIYELDDISTRLQELMDGKDSLGLSVKNEGSKDKNRRYQTSLVDASSIVGREGDKKELVQKLLSDESRNKNFSIVPIVGKDQGRIILNSVENGPLFWPTVEQDDDTVRLKTYEELSNKEKASKLIRISSIQQCTSLSRQLKDERCCLAVLTFLPGDDPIAYMNKAIQFLSVVFTPRYPSTNNQLRSSSNLRNHATVQDGKVTVQQVQGRQGEGHMARQCTQQKQKRDVAWFKEKVLLVQAHAEAFQTKDLDAYDSNYDDIFSAKAVLMANLSSFDSNVLSEVPYSDTFQNDMMNQSVQEL